MRVTKWFGLALCALGLLLGGLVVETVPSPLQAEAGAQGIICDRLEVDTADSSEAPQDCCQQQFTLNAADSHGDGGAPTLPNPELCCDPINTAAGLSSADSAPIYDPCAPPIFCGEPNLVVDDLNSANGQPTFNPCCEQPDYVVQAPQGLNAANGQPTFDPCCEGPPPGYTVDVPQELNSANGQPTFDPCCGEPTGYTADYVNGPTAPLCEEDPCGTTVFGVTGALQAQNSAPVEQDPCCNFGPIFTPKFDDRLSSEEVRPGPGGPGGPGGLCVPVCPVGFIEGPDTLSLESADSRRSGPPPIPECIPICGTQGPPTVREPAPLSSADVGPGDRKGPPGPPCTPICAPEQPTDGSAEAAPVDAPPCVLPCESVDLVEIPYYSGPAGLSAASIEHEGESPPVPPCVPPCVTNEIPHSDVLSSAEMRHGGPPPIQPCIPPCPVDMTNPPVRDGSADLSGGLVVLCDPCFDGQILFATAALESPTEPAVEPVLELDSDCDTIPNDIDCDPLDDTIINTIVDDADCDTIPTSIDCDDTDASVTNDSTNDADCDLTPTADDCNDNDPSDYCMTLEDPYVCGQGFTGSISGGTPTYNLTYTLVPVAGGATVTLPTVVVASAGTFTTAVDHGTISGTHDVTITAQDFVGRTVTESFRATLQISCSTSQAPSEPGITDEQVEEILKIVNARNNAPLGETVSELDPVTAAPVGATSSGGALALTGTASRMLAMFALVFLGFGMTFVGTDRLRQLLPGDEDED